MSRRDRQDIIPLGGRNQGRNLRGASRFPDDEAGGDLGMGSTLPWASRMVREAERGALALAREIEAITTFVPGDDGEALGLQESRSQSQSG
ncbi:hypothetical protein [Methylobacterium brachiatum]|uniref:hypothetical protein n=1 Tax=Methylobacterium brachiatum TaxID=269660 RepID=UPI001ABFC968|nr:hypothetical protein [Methylobacterium brachiatum]